MPTINGKQYKDNSVVVKNQATVAKAAAANPNTVVKNTQSVTGANLTEKQKAGRAELKVSVSPSSSQSGSQSSGQKITMPGGNPTGATFGQSVETQEQKNERLRAGVFMNPQTGAYTDSQGNPIAYNGAAADVGLASDYERKVQEGIYKPAGTVVNSAGTQIGTQSSQQGVNQQGQIVEPTKSTYTPNKPEDTLTDWTQQLGDLKDTFTKQFETLQSRTGLTADINNPDLQKEILAAQQAGEKNFMPILRKYMQDSGVTDQELQGLKAQAIAGGLSAQEAEQAMTELQGGITKFSKDELAQYYRKFIPQGQEGTSLQSEDQSAQQQLTGQLPDKNPSAGYTEDIIPESSPTDKSMAFLDNVTGMDLNSLGANLNSLGLDLTTTNSGEAMAVWQLQTANGIADDPTTTNFRMRVTQNATNAFNSGMNLAEISMSEIDAVISGEDIAPVTLEGLSAKIYKESKDFGMESIENEKAYNKAQYDVWMAQETDKRSRLEGYLKAKLYAAGAQDSSAGLTTMALAVNAADLNIQLKQAEYNYGLSKLNIESRQIMTNYANNIVQLGMDVEAKKGTLMDTYNAKMEEIEGKIIEDDKEKKKLKMDALNAFVSQMDVLDRRKVEDARYEEEKAYNKTKDAIDVAYKLSGLKGTIYGIDENGQLYDTGELTLAAKQNIFTQEMENKRLGLAYAEFDANSKKSQFVTGPDGKMYNYEPSTGNLTELKNLSEGVTLVDIGRGSISGYNYGSHTATPGDNRKLANGETGHPGIDIGAKNKGVDGDPIPVVIGGTVTKIVSGCEAGNKSCGGGYGNRVIVTDANGNEHMYSHLLGVNVEMGQQVNTGTILGQMGNTGNSTGTHLDYRVHAPNDTWLDPREFLQSQAPTGEYTKLVNDAKAMGMNDVDARKFADKRIDDNYKPLTEVQGKAFNAYVLMAPENETFNNVYDGLSNPEMMEVAKDMDALNRALQSEGTLTEGMIFDFVNKNVKSDLGKKLITAEMTWLEAALRDESGAQINASEYMNKGTNFFPRPGDTAEMIKIKAERRDVATQGKYIKMGESAQRQLTEYEKESTENPWEIVDTVDASSIFSEW